MKQLIVLIAAALVLSFQTACQTDHEGNVQPTPEAREAGHDASTAAKEAGQEIKEGAQRAGAAIQEGARQVQESDAGQRVPAGAREAGQGIKQGAGEAAEAAGDALKREGQEAQKEAAATKTQT